ncbi:MAG: DUF4838 domain-containing protein [Phycisphaerales bacterium]|nr:DUF4838 domain-containing protein [Phycisphaerales bacterium]
MLNLIGFVALVIGCASSVRAVEGTIGLVVDGKSSAVIVTPEQMPNDVKLAVDELLADIAKSTGAMLAVEQTSSPGRLEIHIGQTPYVKSLKLSLDDLGVDGFRILFPAADRIILVGGSPTGTEFAVYDFLERYVGVRWLFPGDIGTYIPKVDQIMLPVQEITSRPAYISRVISTYHAERWLHQQRQHWTIQQHHNLNKLFAPDKYYDQHPEFYPLIDGKRQKPDSEGYVWQPMLDAPGIVDAAVKSIDHYFDENPSITSFSLGVNDNNNFNHPATYKNSVGQSDYSDYYFNFTNQVIEGVLKTHPDKWFGCLAYMGVTDPPRDIKVNGRMVPYICIDRQGWASDEGRTKDMQRTRNWHAAAPVIGWYDYIYGGDNYRIPRIYPHLMGQYIKFGSENGVKAMYAELYASAEWIEGPKLYLFMKLLWDPTTDLDQTLSEWYRLAVGQKAAGPLAKYYQLWEDYWMKRVPRTDWFNQYVGQVYMDFDQLGYLDELNLQDLEQARQLMDQVVALADTPDHKARAAFFDKGLRRVEDEVGYLLRLRGKMIAVKDHDPLLLEDSFKTTSTQLDEKIPQPWGGWQNSPGTGRFFWDHQHGHGDSQCLAFDAKGAGVGAVIYRDFKLDQPAEMYHMGTQVRVDGVNPDAYIGIEIRWSRPDGQYIPRRFTANRFYSAKLYKDGQWTKLDVYAKPPPGQGPLSMSVRLSVVNSTHGIIRMDDVVVGGANSVGQQ